MTENTKCNRIELVTHQRNGCVTYEANFIINDKCEYAYMLSCIELIEGAIHAYFKEIGKKDLSNFLISDLNLSYFDFADTDLTNTVFDNCDLRHCNFNNANLTNARLHTSKIDKSNLINAIVKNTSIMAGGEPTVFTNFKFL